jgi:hypothetical protein
MMSVPWLHPWRKDVIGERRCLPCGGHVSILFRIGLWRNSHFREMTVDNQEEIMDCERCGGLKLLDRFYGMANDGSVWMYDGVRCLNCGSINKPMRGNEEVSHAERANQYGLSVRPVASC